MQRVTTKLNVRCYCRNLGRMVLSRAASSNRVSSSTRRSTSAAGSESQMDDEISSWPRKIFSGIQPTGAVHLGNYLGAVKRWVELQETREDVTICIVDMHSITLPQSPPVLRENIFKMAATLVSCGIDPTQSTLFVQSAVTEHSEFNWILNCMTTMARLGQLPQFKEKSKSVRDVPLGLFVYPVLQAADIMLYKSTHVPVGADQVQHIQLAQHLARNFNTRYGDMFPVCQAMIDNNEASRIRSLRNPGQKMSKSDTDTKATINVSDEPEVIVEKIKKSVTDFNSDVTYDPKTRPGVSNLVSIHSLVTGAPIADIVDEAKALDTGSYKLRVAEAVIEHLRPIREQINHHLARRNELTYMLEVGAEKARQQAQQTMSEVKQRLGLGTYLNTPMPVQLADHLQERAASSLTASQRMHRAPKGGGGQKDGGGAGAGGFNVGGAGQASATGDGTQASEMPIEADYDLQRRGKGLRTMPSDYRPMVPVQEKRVEKVLRKTPVEPFKIPQPIKMAFHVNTPSTTTTNSFPRKTPLNQNQNQSSFKIGHPMHSTASKMHINMSKAASTSKANMITQKSILNTGGTSGSSSISSNTLAGSNSSINAQSAASAAASTGYQSQSSTYQQTKDETESDAGSEEDDDNDDNDDDPKLKKVEI